MVFLKQFYTGERMLAAFFILISLCIPISAEEAVNDGESRVVIGGSYDYPPYSYIDENGEPAGFTLDISKAISKALNRRIVFQMEPWGDVLKSLQNKKTDLIHDIVYSKARSELYDFSEPYYISPYAVFAKKSAPELSSFSDLKGKRIVVVRGDIGHDYLKELGIVAYIHVVDNYADAILLLENGDFQYTMTDQLAGLYWIKTIGSKNIEITKIVPFHMKYCYAKLPGDRELLLEINGALSVLRENGEYQAIYKKWMLKVDPSYLSAEEIIKKYIWILIPVSAGILLLFVWNFTLHKKVAERTASLERTNKFLLEREQRIRSISNNIQSGMIYQLVIAADGTRRFTYLSDSVRSLYGITPEEGMADANLIYKKIYQQDALRLAKEEEEAIKSVSTFKSEVRIISPSGGIRWASFVSIPRQMDDGSICFDGIDFDITERKQTEAEIETKNEELVAANEEMEASNEELVAISEELQKNEKVLLDSLKARRLSEERIKNLLSEKELLLQEVHHRIKNNMNTIKGLLSLQISSEENPSAVSSLRDAESRVQSMIMLYDRLYCTDNYREMPVKDYFQSLAEEITGSFSNRAKVKINTDIEDFILNVNKLAPLAIIINELLTNMMKYAFNGRENGVINLSASLKDNLACITISDDGVGIPESVSLENHTGFGLELVRLLMEQMGGSIRIERGGGTRFVLEFAVTS